MLYRHIFEQDTRMNSKTFYVLLTLCLFGITTGGKRCTRDFGCISDAEVVNPCPYGSPLHGHYCGRGGHPCPAFSSCVISPVDAFAVCCPNYCKSGKPILDASGDPVHCGRGGMQCPDSYYCEIAPTDAWAVCCPSA